jgi:hypothetical protein
MIFFIEFFLQSYKISKFNLKKHVKYRLEYQLIIYKSKEVFEILEVFF